MGKFSIFLSKPKSLNFHSIFFLSPIIIVSIIQKNINNFSNEKKKKMKDFGFYRISFSFLRSCFSSTYRKLISNLVEMCVNSRTHPHPLRRKPRAAHLGQASGGHRLICRMAPVVEHLKKGNRGSRFGVSASEKLCSMRCRVWPKLLKAAVRFALSALSKST